MSFFSIPAGSPPNINFFNIITVPPAGSLQNYLTVSDIKIDPASIPREGDILGAEGVVTLKIHFYVDTKVVNDNSLSEIRFSIFDQDPTIRTVYSKIFAPGTSKPDPLTPISPNASTRVVNPIRTLSVQISNNKNQIYDIITNNSGVTSNHTISQGSISESVTPLDSERNILLRVLNYSHLDPTEYLNWNYFSNVERSKHLQQGLVLVDKSNEFTKLNYVSLSSKNRQIGLSQQNPDSFINNSDINSLYKSSKLSLSENNSIEASSLSINSRLREYQVLFNIKMSQIDVRSLTNIYLRSEIIDSNKNIRSRIQNSINFFQEIQGHITPVSPASIKVDSISIDGNTLSISQNDIIASTVTLYRMIVNPRQPKSALTKWQRLTEIPLLKSSGEIKYVDSSSVSVLSPSFIVYEAVCSGPTGSKCPVSKKTICSGKRRNSGAQRERRAQTHCSITAHQDQQSNQIFIRVADIPSDISRLILRRQLMSSAVRQNDSRYHDVITTASGNKFYRVGSEILEYEFIDKNVSDRSIYRYYVEFDNLSGIRTESASDEIIQFRTPPQTKIVSSISANKLPSPQDLTTSFQLNARFKSEGLKGLNDILTSQGVADLFKADLRTDRSQISKLLVYEVCRKNTRTGDKIVWPSINPGQFIDNEITRSFIGRQNDSLIAGDTYVYTANLLILDPEALFTSSTTSRVSADGLRRIQISAKKFAEDYSVQPGKMISPTTLSRSLTRASSISSYFTGITHSVVVKVPKNYTDIINTRATRSNKGIPANIISWNISESSIKEKIYCFRIDIVTNRSTVTPLMTVSPNSTLDGISYEIRDEININKVYPVQYIVSTINSDMSRDRGFITEEIPGISSYPEEIIQKIRSSI